MTDPVPRAILIVGMHRSGTSATAGMLHHLGVQLGSNLLPANEYNLTGYWEHVDIVAVHDELLQALGSEGEPNIAFRDQSSPVPLP